MMNLFTLHTKNGFFIHRCMPIETNENEDANKNLNLPQENVELINNFKPECIWSQDRFARQCVCSYNNNLALLDDRSGLSIVYIKSVNTSELSMDTLRGVGKFKNMYTPLGCKNIKHLQWSNNGIYLAVYFNLPNYSEAGLCLDDNLHIWDISKKNIVVTFSTRRLSPEHWPVIKWLGMTDSFALCHNHQVNVYSIVSEPSSLKSVRCLLTIQVPLVFSAELYCNPLKDNKFGEGDKVHLACFSQTEGNNAHGNLRISILEWNSDHFVEKTYENHELKYTDSAELLWSPSGKYLIVLAHSTVDMAGEKYGSTANCVLYSYKGKYINKMNSATTHDVRWNPKNDEFILMQGNMPCKITLYGANLEKLFEFPNMYRNTIRWNPMGNMVALGGFGNLAGEICFWYKKEDGNEMEQIVQFKEPCTVISEWSLDSKYFMTASTFPRMKVDNFYKIFNCEGYLIASENLDECYDVSWFCGNQDEKEFIKPKVRKSLVRKAVYRPKVLQKSNKTSPNTAITSQIGTTHQGVMSTNTGSQNPILYQSTQYHRFPRAPGSPIFRLFKTTGDPSTYSPPRPRDYEAHSSVRDRYKDRDKMNKSIFSNEYGNKCDPSTDLLQSFKHIFSLSFMKNGENMGNRQGIHQRSDHHGFRPHDGYNQDHQRSSHRQKYGDGNRHSYLGLHTNNGQANLSSNSRPGYGETSRGSYADNGRSSFSERQVYQDSQRQTMSDNRQICHGSSNSSSSSGNGNRKSSVDESKHNSMFIRLKNQLHSDKAKTQNHSIMDEGQLLRLLLEAKIRSKPN